MVYVKVCKCSADGGQSECELCESGTLKGEHS